MAWAYTSNLVATQRQSFYLAQSVVEYPFFFNALCFSMKYNRTSSNASPPPPHKSVLSGLPTSAHDSEHKTISW